MSKQETVEVTIKVPKRIVNFLKDYEKGFDMTLEEYCLHAIIQMVGTDIDAIDLALGPAETIVENYGLEIVLKEYNALPYMAKEC